MEFYERSLEEYNMDGWQVGGYMAVMTWHVMSYRGNSNRAKKSENLSFLLGVSNGI